MPTIIMDRRQLLESLTSHDGRTYIRLVGAPGSGKTTIAKEWEENFHVPCLSMDRMLSANRWMYSILEMLHEEFHKQLLKALQAGTTICDDNLNLDRRERARTAARIKSSGHRLVTVFIDASLELCLKQNRMRDANTDDLWTGGVVPEDKLREFHQLLQERGRPDASEGEVYRLTPIPEENRYEVERVLEDRSSASLWWWQRAWRYMTSK